MLKERSRLTRVLALALAASPLTAAEVWRSTYELDGIPDGMEVVRDGPAKMHFTGPTGGRLTVENWDNSNSAFAPDKCGRPLGATLTGDQSFSGLYRFHWSALNTETTQAYEFVGFLGDAAAQTRHVCGTLLRHWKSGDTFFVATDLAFGGAGNTGFGYLAGNSAALGTNPVGQEFQLAIGYDGVTHVLTVGLFDNQGQQVSVNSADLDTDVPGLQSPATPLDEILSINLTHLGWSDYTGNGGDRATVWQIDDLIYHDSSSGAFDQAGNPDPSTGACCRTDGSCLDATYESNCTFDGGQWLGAESTCIAGSCQAPAAGACCAIDGTCSETIESSCAGFWQGPDTSCLQASCIPYDPADEPWDVVYDGVDSAADNVPNFLRWDSAIDDDWNQPGGSTFQLNTPSIGLMSVDRASSESDAGKTGNIWIRDPILSHAQGFTIEVRVKIEPNSDPNAYSITSLDDGGSFGVQLSPDQVKAGDLSPTGPGTTISFDTTDDFHLYRVVKHPGSLGVDVYVDNQTIPLVSGSGNTGNRTGSSPFLLYPRILIGDNSNDTAINAHYVLDLVRYRRGATAPGETPPVLSPRELPPLPLQPVGEETWTVGYDGVGEPGASGWIQGGGSAWTQHSDGIMELNTLSAAANARIDNPVPGWSNRQAVTLEARVQVLPDSQEAGFNLVANDQAGDIALALSPGKVELLLAYMPVGRVAVPMDTTDRFHTYRLTRETDGLYWHLYIDNGAQPAISYQHAGGNLLSFSRIWFGDIAFPIPANGCHVLIDYVRWHEGATAPVPDCANPVFDADGDGDVDIADFGELQSCLTGADDPSDVFDGEACHCFDTDHAGLGDGDVDDIDLALFLQCLSGNGMPADEQCDDEER